MRSFVLAVCTVLLATVAAAQPSPVKGITPGVRPAKFAIRNATIVDGSPARGPVDIVVEGGRIVDVVPIDPVAVKEGIAKRPAAPAEIDAAGKFVLPGLVNAHAHMQSVRAGKSMGGFDYYFKLQLASGVTTLREVGAENDTGSIRLRDRSARGEIAAPRIFVYPFFDFTVRVRNAAEAKARVQEMKRIGSDGIKIGGIDRDIFNAMAAEAKVQGLPIAHHVGVEETNAWDDVRLGTRSIEHWYGAAGRLAIPSLTATGSIGTTSTMRPPSTTMSTGPRAGERGVGADAGDLRGEPRPAAGADAALVP